VGICELDASDLRRGLVAGSCEHGNTLSGSMKGGRDSCLAK